MALLPPPAAARIDLFARRATWGEIALVLGLPVSLFLYGALAATPGPARITDAGLVGTVLTEAIMAALLLPYLSRRGWTPRVAAGGPEPWDLVQGVGVCIAGLAAFYVAYYASVLNPIFEEFLWLGYAVPAVGSRLGLRAACVVSIALRTSIHLYQGAMAFVGILPGAVIFTLYFARTRRLWPVVVAHVLMDAAALATAALAAR